MSQVAHVCLGLAIVDLARETQRSGGRHFFPNELSSGQTQGSFTEFANFVVIHFNSAMPNRNLSADELKRANELLAVIRERLVLLAAGDPLLLFAYQLLYELRPHG